MQNNNKKVFNNKAVGENIIFGAEPSDLHCLLKIGHDFIYKAANACFSIILGISEVTVRYKLN